MTDLRVWRAGDPEPPLDVTLLHNRRRASFQMAYLRRVGTGWWWVTSPHETLPTDTRGWGWRALSRTVELVEVGGHR
jgi:hypothetical protein